MLITVLWFTSLSGFFFWTKSHNTGRNWDIQGQFFSCAYISTVDWWGRKKTLFWFTIFPKSAMLKRYSLLKIYKKFIISVIPCKQFHKMNWYSQGDLAGSVYDAGFHFVCTIHGTAVHKLLYETPQKITMSLVILEVMALSCTALFFFHWNFHWAIS